MSDTHEEEKEDICIHRREEIMSCLGISDPISNRKLLRMRPVSAKQVKRKDISRPTIDKLNQEHSLDCVMIAHCKVPYKDNWLVYLASYVEDFHALCRLAQFEGNIVCFRDVSNVWYTERLDPFLDWMEERIPKDAQITFIGQSMGAHFALMLGAKREGVVLAFSPQTLQTNKSLWFHPSLPCSKTPPYMQDIREYIKTEGMLSQCYVIVSAEETQNLYSCSPPFFWADMVHAGYLASLQNIRICIFPSDCHAMFGANKFETLTPLLLHQWSDMKQGKTNCLSSLEFVFHPQKNSDNKK